MKMRLLGKLIVAYVAMAMAFSVLMIGVSCIPRSAVSRNVVSSMKVMEDEGLYRQIMNFKLFQLDNFTDTYMMNLIVSADSQHPVEAAMMNYNYKSSNFLDLAYDTEKVAQDQFPSGGEDSYARYWHGYQIVLKPLLVIMDYSAIRIVNYIAMAILLFGVAVLMWKLVGRKACVLFLTSLLLINFPIVPLSLQFSTCFYISFIAMLLVMKWHKIWEDESNLLTLFFCIGGVTAFMDFLTTPQLTLGLPLICYMLMSEKKGKWKQVICVSCVWALGYGLLWASKWGLGYLLTGNDILAAAKEAAELRTSDVYKGMHMTVPGIVGFIWNVIQAKHLVGVLVAALLFVFVMTVVYVKAIDGKKKVKDYAYLLIIMLMVPVWFLVLRNHSIQHGWFTWRAGLLSLYSLLLFVGYTSSWKNIINKKAEYRHE